MPAFIVQINWKVVGDDLTAVDYADRLRPESERFDPELYERLAQPLGAQALHHFSLTIVDSAEARLGNRWLLRRQVRLAYPPDADFADIEQRLNREGTFGRIERDRRAAFSATPNDPIFEPYTATTAPQRYNRQRWAFDQLDLADAWDLTRGTATLAIVDSGVWWNEAAQRFHPELDRKLLRLSSGPGTNRSAAWLPTATGDSFEVVNLPLGGPFSAGHGTHVAALAAAVSGNGRGGAGGCPGCLTAIVAISGSFKVPNRVTDPIPRGSLDDGLPYIWRTGAQVVNRSGSTNSAASTCVRLSDYDIESQADLDAIPFENDVPQCAGFRELADRDIPIVVSAGNNRREIGWPANGWFAISVGGTDVTESGQFSYWDEDTGQPPGPADINRERGSNRGPEQDFAAPARRVLSAFVAQGQWANRCSDTVPEPKPGFAPPPDGEVFPTIGPDGEAYEWCTGTSMSAPLVSAVAGLVKSLNPLLEVDQVYEAMKRSAQALPGIPQRDPRIGWGLPQAHTALLEVLGKTGSASYVAGPQNRLTPMFHLHNGVLPCTDNCPSPSVQSMSYCAPAAPNADRSALEMRSSGAHLFTTKPQVALAAMLNELYVDGGELQFGICPPPSILSFFSSPNRFDAAQTNAYPFYPSRPALLGLNIDAEVVIPHAAFMVFTTEQAVGGASMVPLYRVAYDDPWPLRNVIIPGIGAPNNTLYDWGVLTEPGNKNKAIAQACPGLTREFGYATGLAEVESYWEAFDPCPSDNAYLDPEGLDARFELDGLEGYVWQSCPAAFVSAGCNGQGGRPDALFLRGQGPSNGSGDQNWALIVGSALATEPTYATCRPGSAAEPGTGRCGFLGYVFRNIDSDGDGLVDGQEWMLGTNPTLADTDNDGFSDSVEFPPYRYLPPSNPLDAQSTPDPIFASGVES